MKRGFSVGAAVAEPFRLAFKRPLSTIAWGLVMILPSVLILAALGPMIVEMVESGRTMEGTGGSSPGDFETFRQFVAFQAWSGLGNILSLLAVLLVTTAMIRAVLRGAGSRGAPFLGVGKDEFHVAVIGIAIVVGVFAVVMFVGAIIAAFGIASVASSDGMSWAAWVAVGLGFAVAMALLVVWGRLALIAPVAVMRGDLAFAEGWRAGRGQTGRLFLLFLALIAVSIAFGLAILAVFLLGVALFGGGLAAWGDEREVEAWMLAQIANPWPAVGVGLVLLIPLAWVQGLGQALWTAPYALAARELSQPPTTPGADAAGPAD